MWCPKYRRRVIGGCTEARLNEVIAEVIAEKGVWRMESGTIADRVHLLVEADPQCGIHQLVKVIKKRSSRVQREEIPRLNLRLPSSRTNSYFVATVGGALLSVIRRYAETQTAF